MKRLTNDRVAYAYAGTYFPRPAWRRWEVIALALLATAAVVAFGWPVAAYVARSI